MIINNKNIDNLFYIYVTSHLIVWTLIPTVTNHNLPLDTIEALAWGSNLDWGFNKHPPMSAFYSEVIIQNSIFVSSILIGRVKAQKFLHPTGYLNFKPNPRFPLWEPLRGTTSLDLQLHPCRVASSRLSIGIHGRATYPSLCRNRNHQYLPPCHSSKVPATIGSPLYSGIRGPAWPRWVAPRVYWLGALKTTLFYF